MLVPRKDPFPFEAVRDLIGILRAMYRAAKANGAGARRLAELRQVGLELRHAIELALEYAPNTLGHAAAWERAELATRGLGNLIDCTTPLEPTIAAAVERVRARVPVQDLRELSRRARSSRN
jgi:hypothetical protein